MLSGFGKRLRTAIQDKGINNSKLAGELKVSPAVITQWCKEETYPSLKHFSNLCIVLEISPSELLYKQKRATEEEEILRTAFRFRPAVRKALITFLNLI